MYWYVLYVMVCTGMHLHVLKQIVHIDEYWLVLDCICVYWYLLTFNGCVVILMSIGWYLTVFVCTSTY